MWRLFITLYFSLAIFILAYDFLSDEFLFAFYEDEFVEDRERDMRSWLLTLDSFTSQASSQELSDLIGKSNEESNFPMKILSTIEAEKKYPEAVSQINQNNFSFIDLDEVEFLYWMKNRQEYLKIGPIQTVSRLKDIDSLLQNVYLLLLAVVLLLWHLNLWRKLANLEHRMVEFGEGELTARASEKPSTRVGMLNRSFNSMADKTEQLLQQNRQLIRAVSHELRSPISRMRCLVDLLDSSNSHSQQVNYLNAMSEDILELEALVDEVLNYSQLEASGLIAISTQEQTLKPLLVDLLSTLNREFSREIRLVCHADIDARIDAIYLRRAVGNLVQNAVKYCTEEVEVSVEVDDKYSTILIHVDDDGPGIPLEEQARIFEPFARLDQSRARESGGYGLGLAIVKQIASLHRGRILVSTSPLGGSRFTVELPR